MYQRQPDLLCELSNHPDPRLTANQLTTTRFFATQNPVIGLLDPELHTPENVYATSFTLFSVICALGCAVSTRPRDKVIYHGLLQLAEGNMQWCIAASVTSLETIQAILLMYHWAPVRHGRVSDDPSRLHLSHVSNSQGKATAMYNELR